MSRLHFKRFSDLSFLQRLDRRWLKHLLSEHADYLARNGLDLSKLRNDDATRRLLVRIFTGADEEMPPSLVEALYLLDDLSDEIGHDRILVEAERLRIDLSKYGRDLSPGELAIAAFVEDRRLVDRCHERTLHQKVKNYEEFQSQETKRLTLNAARKKRGALEQALAPWFESKNRSRAFEVFEYEETGEIKFQITHGRPLRTEGSIDKRLRRSRVVYRPQAHDSVVYDNSTGVLRIHAGTMAERERYRQSFGKVFFGDEGHFPDGLRYTLDPLRARRPTLASVSGLGAVRLTEVWVRIDAAKRFLQVSKAADLLDCMESYGRPNLAEGTLLRAAFLLTYGPRGRPRRLEVRPPNVAVYDRDRDGAVTEAFLRANALLKT